MSANSFNRFFGTFSRMGMILMAIGLSACGASSADKANGSEQVTKLAADRFCGPVAGVEVYDDDRHLSETSMVIAQAIVKSAPDWTTTRLLRINMGQQANMGYGLDYTGGARLEGQSLVIPIQWQTPQPGRMYAQMLVEPCLLLAIPRSGYQQIEIHDQDGRLRWSVDVSVL